jgi:hypothetical protein
MENAVESFAIVYCVDGTTLPTPPIAPNVIFPTDL